MECVCGASAIMACTKHGHSVGILLHPVECDLPCDLDARFGGTSMLRFSDYHISLSTDCVY